MFLAEAGPRRHRESWTKIDRAKPTRVGGWTSTHVTPALRRQRAHTWPIEEGDEELYVDALVDAELPGHIIWTMHKSNNKTSTSTREKAAHVEIDNKHQSGTTL